MYIFVQETAMVRINQDIFEDSPSKILVRTDVYRNVIEGDNDDNNFRVSEVSGSGFSPTNKIMKAMEPLYVY